jgi:phosphate starvation-inducible PhoH-like protein
MSVKTRARKVGTSSMKKNTSSLLFAPSFEWTEKQKVILDTMNYHKTNCVIVNALAGTGKTTLAIYSALQHLQRGLVDKILYIRTPVEASHSKLGYLKGSIDDKFGPYTEILFEKLRDFLSEQEITTLITEKKVEAAPVAFLRGHDFKRTIVITDEAQNLYMNELMTVATRIASESKLFILADEDQCDLPKKDHDEFMKFARLFNDDDSMENGIFYFELKNEMDVMRSEFVRYISKKYNTYKKSLS